MPFYARFCRKAVEQQAAAGAGIMGMLVKETLGAPDFRAERRQGVEVGELGAAAVKRLDHADVAEQVVSVLDHIVIEFGAGGVCHSVASYYGFKPL